MVIHRVFLSFSFLQRLKVKPNYKRCLKKLELFQLIKTLDLLYAYDVFNPLNANVALI